MDVLEAAWRALDEPVPEGLVFDVVAGCARCGEDQRTCDARHVVSGNWTNWDQWHTTTRARLCRRCAWGYRAEVLRSSYYAVMAEPAGFRVLTHGELRALLSRPLDRATCVVVPLRLNRKHIAPQARWGFVCVDDTALAWTAQDAQRLEAMVRLREMGFGSDMLARPVPAYGPVSRLPAPQRAEAMGLWPQLAPWRERRPWLEVGLRASMPTKEG
ncbi:hypothetical protein [Wenjunlia tyrosinilytica]|jgi:hypothetical protein|uniref:Uncharacterized protein n=1 Tax=Wenjunlia tyrosinilytica TaxID=1544741 RepID=A0A917ZXS1_9ACTN|nr:hypothetical protein [Wenjunlia tyrosinilytica]GGO97994.1 hypothetical protein GCM10012280_61090 [Wenjunlia tyrosinilytica]